MSSDPFKYDLAGHLLNEYTKGIYMKPKPDTKKPDTKKPQGKKYGGTYKGKK